MRNVVRVPTPAAFSGCLLSRSHAASQLSGTSADAFTFLSWRAGTSATMAFAPVATCAARWASTSGETTATSGEQAVSVMASAEGGGSAGGGSTAVSTAVEDEPEEHTFDVIEATLQEVHDLSIAIHTHLLNRHLPYASKADMRKAAEMFTDMTQKLLKLLTPPVAAALLASSKSLNVERTKSVKDRFKATKIPKDMLDRMSYATSAVFTHAPFELRIARPDIPDRVTKQARALRDRNTLRLLLDLAESDRNVAADALREKLVQVLPESRGAVLE